MQLVHHRNMIAAAAHCSHIVVLHMFSYCTPHSTNSLTYAARCCQCTPQCTLHHTHHPNVYDSRTCVGILTQLLYLNCQQQEQPTKKHAKSWRLPCCFLLSRHPPPKNANFFPGPPHQSPYIVRYYTQQQLDTPKYMPLLLAATLRQQSKRVLCLTQVVEPIMMRMSYTTMLPAADLSSQTVARHHLQASPLLHAHVLAPGAPIRRARTFLVQCAAAGGNSKAGRSLSAHASLVRMGMLCVSVRANLV